MKLFFVLMFTTIIFGTTACQVAGESEESDDTEECLVGMEGCACTPGGACDPGLTCYSETCVDAGGDADTGTEDTDPVVDTGTEDTDPVADTATEDTDPVVDTATEDTDPVVDTATEDTDPVVDTATEDTDPVVDTGTEDTDPVVDTATEDTDPVVDTATEDTDPVVDTATEDTDTALPYGAYKVWDEGYVTSGPWGGYAWTESDSSVGTTVNPMDYSTVQEDETICMDGVVSTGEGWAGFAMMGFNVGQGPWGGEQGSVVPTDLGIHVDIANLGGSEVRLHLLGAGANFWCAPITQEGGEFIPWGDFNTECWPGGMGTDYNGSDPLVSISVVVPGNPDTDTPFHVCMNSYELLGATDIYEPYKVWDGGYVTSWAQKGYAFTVTDDYGSTVTPSDYSSVLEDETLCMTGTLAEAASWEGFAMLGLNLNQETGGAQAGAVVPSSMGVYVDVTDFGNSGARVQIEDASGFNRWCAIITQEGGEFIPWGDFNTQCWPGGNGEYYNGADPFERMSITVNGVDGTDTPYDICLNSYEFYGEASPENSLPYGAYKVWEGGYVTSWDWRGYAFTVADDLGSTVAPSDYSSVLEDEALCMSGTLAAEASWEGFAMMGMNLNQDMGGTERGTVTPAGMGIYVDVTNFADSTVRVQIENGLAGRWCAPITQDGGQFIPWGDFNTQCWPGGNGEYYNGADPFEMMSITVNGVDGFDTPFDVCLNFYELANN